MFLTHRGLINFVLRNAFIRVLFQFYLNNIKIYHNQETIAEFDKSNLQ